MNFQMSALVPVVHTHPFFWWSALSVTKDTTTFVMVILAQLHCVSNASVSLSYFIVNISFFLGKKDLGFDQACCFGQGCIMKGKPRDPDSVRTCNSCRRAFDLKCKASQIGSACEDLDECGCRAMIEKVNIFLCMEIPTQNCRMRLVRCLI